MDEIKEDSLWIYCPVCHAKTRVKVYSETVLIKFPLFCPKCKHETLIDVVKLKMVSKKPPKCKNRKVKRPSGDAPNQFSVKNTEQKPGDFAEMILIKM